MSIKEQIQLGSKTAKDGFQNERDIARKFENWKKDDDAKEWLRIMEYDLEEIERVEAEVLPNNYKSDIQVKISIYLKKAISAENISIKLVSNPKGFNQIDKRWVDKYRELWDIPENVTTLLKYFTGEKAPYKKTRDKRRMFLDELTEKEQKQILNFFNENKILIITDILKGRDRLSAEWMMVALKDEKNTKWTLQPISKVMNYFGNGDIDITNRGSLRIGRITVQRKGGDRGRKTANMLQFKINPAELFDL